MYSYIPSLPPFILYIEPRQTTLSSKIETKHPLIKRGITSIIATVNPRVSAACVALCDAARALCAPCALSTPPVQQSPRLLFRRPIPERA